MARLALVAPPLALMALIWCLGGRSGSAEATRALIERLLEAWWPTWLARPGPAAIATLNLLLRKSAHFLVYALLGHLDARAIGGLWGTNRGRGALAAWLAATAWAAVDEWHQSLDGTRGASAIDAALDAAGAALAVWLRTRGARAGPALDGDERADPPA
jgi:VanZ family protein